MTQFNLNTGGIICGVSYTQTMKVPIYELGGAKPVRWIGKQGIVGSVTFLTLPKSKFGKNQKLTINQDGILVQFTGVEFLHPKRMKTGEPAIFIAKQIHKTIGVS